ncbi:MAG: hypothetical protein KAG53_07935, partial [Endozoicomonadaceae bacterium]|nr:hypothetical protein [Endozoicomonadaceae bacterium]
MNNNGINPNSTPIKLHNNVQEDTPTSPLVKKTGDFRGRKISSTPSKAQVSSKSSFHSQNISNRDIQNTSTSPLLSEKSNFNLPRNELLEGGKTHLLIFKVAKALTPELKAKGFSANEPIQAVLTLRKLASEMALTTVGDVMDLLRGVKSKEHYLEFLAPATTSVVNNSEEMEKTSHEQPTKTTQPASRLNDSTIRQAIQSHEQFTKPKSPKSRPPKPPKPPKPQNLTAKSGDKNIDKPNEKSSAIEQPTAKSDDENIDQSA